MPPRRNKEKLQELTDFELDIIGLREGGFSYRAIGARVQRNSSTVRRISKHFFQAARKFTATGVLMSASSIRRRLLHRGLRAFIQDSPQSTGASAMSTEPGKRQVVFSAKSRFNLWDQDGRIRAGERCLPESVIERHSCLTSGVIVWGAILYHGRSSLLRIEGHLNSNRYVR
ncbi:transposable element Tc1 transposase [Trichonephila clavipes]|nr:transposable element Tc1 transposase [Trichonephila clavipes]